MIYQIETEEILRLVAKYYFVNQIIRDEPIEIGELKKRLMDEYGLAESTARSYINAIIDDQAGVLHLAEDDTVYANQDEVIEFEERLEGLFNWDRFDYRHKLYVDALVKLKEAEFEIKGLNRDLDKAYTDFARVERKYKKEIDDLEVRLGNRRCELEETKRELLNTQNNLIRVKARLSMLLEDWTIWRFMTHRIDFHLCSLLSKIAKEDKGWHISIYLSPPCLPIIRSFLMNSLFWD